MQGVFVLVLVGLTSIAGAVFVMRRLAWPATALATGALAALELLGAGLVCFLVNLGLGVAVILLVRALSPSPVSVYVLNDVALLALSLVQGLVFQGWRQATRGPRHAISRSRSSSSSSG